MNASLDTRTCAGYAEVLIHLLCNMPILACQDVYGWTGHGAGVRGLAFHAGGELVASASMDGTARVWHAASGACRQTLRCAAPP